MAKLDRLGWAGHHTYRLGRTNLGLRASEARYLDALASALAAHLQLNAEAPANFSVILPHRDGSAISLGALHHGHQQILRTSDVARLTRGLLSHLGSYARVPEYLTVRRTVAIRDGAAVLVPYRVSTLPQSLVADLESHGIHLHDAPGVEIDFERGEAVIPELALTLNEAPLQDYRNGLVMPIAGRFALVGVVEEKSGEAEPSPLLRLAQLLRGSTNLEELGFDRVVDRLLVLTDQTRVITYEGRRRELSEAVILALG